MPWLPSFGLLGFSAVALCSAPVLSIVMAVSLVLTLWFSGIIRTFFELL